MPGFWELLIVLAIIVLIFGAGRLPQLGEQLGSALKKFKRSSSAKDELPAGEAQAKLPAAEETEPPKDRTD